MEVGSCCDTSADNTQQMRVGCLASQGDLGETLTAFTTAGITVRLGKGMDPDVLHFYLDLIFILFPLNFCIVPSHV